MKFILKKILVLFITLILVSLIAFFAFQILPGDPVMVMLGVDGDPQQAEILRHELGLDKPMIEQYWNWLSGIFRGDLGVSIKYQLPVADLLRLRIEPTVFLSVFSLLITILIGVPVGVWLAINNKKRISTFISMITQLGVAIPSFWMGIILIFIFSVLLRFLPSGGYTQWSINPILCLKSLLMPAVAISFGSSAVVIRYLKSTMLDEIKLDYVRTAYSKGLSEKRIIYGHVLRNALIPVITVFGLTVTQVIAGSIVVENVFALPGLGSLMLSAISARDLILSQSLTMYIAIIIVVVNSLVDILYGVVDPRMRLK